MTRPHQHLHCYQHLLIACFAAAVVLANASPARAICDVIPQPDTVFRGATGSVNRVFASENDPVVVTRDPNGCEASTPDFGSTPADDSVVTLVYTPPQGPATAVVLGSSLYCGTAWPTNGYAAACEAQLGPGSTAVCDPTGAVIGVPDSLTFRMRTQGRSGPVKIAVSSAGAGPPCQIAAQRCADQSGLAACIDELYAADGTCETATANRHSQFPGVTALPAPNDFAGICNSSDPSIPCSNDGADVRFSTDSAGNLLVPINWAGVLVPGTLPIPRLVRASTSVPAFSGTPPEPNQTPGAPIAVPSLGFLQSFSPKGLRVDPLFDPLFNPDVADTELFGSADAKRGVLRVLRRSPVARQCEAGSRAGLPCIGNPQCPGSSCVPALCRGGSNAGSQCTSDSMCPGGECGASLFDFSDRYSAGGTGPILLSSSDYSAEAQNPAAIDGLASTPNLFMFVRSEPLEGKDLNLDGDQLDQTIVTLRDAATGQEQPISTLPGGAGRASTRLAYRNFRFPTVSVEDDLLAFLEVEAYEGDTDENGDNDEGDAILRVFRQQPSGPVELTDPVQVVTPDPVPDIDSKALEISDGLVFTRLSERAATLRLRTKDQTTSINVSRHIRMTPDGRFVVFHSNDALAPTHNTDAGNVWIYDRDPDQNGIYDEPGQTSVESVSDCLQTGGGSCDNATQCPGSSCSWDGEVWFDVTPDGRYVAFESSYQNLVSNDTNGVLDVFVRDRQTGTTTRVDLAGTSGQVTGNDYPYGGVAISDNGRFVAFVSAATFPGLTCPTLGSHTVCVYVRDRMLRTTSLVGPVATMGTKAGNTGLLELVSMSGDGRYVTMGEGIESDVQIVDRDANGDGIYNDPVVLPTPGGLLSHDGRYSLSWFDPPILRYDRDPTDLGFFDFLGAPATATLPLPQVAGIASQQSLGEAMQLSPDGRFAARVVGTLTTNYLAALSDIDGGIAEILASNLSTPSRQGVATSTNGLFTAFKNSIGRLQLSGIDTQQLTGDLNGDGDVGDVILAVADARGSVPLAINQLGPAGEVAVAAGNAVFLRPESATGAGIDLNGDGDTNDQVVHLWRNRQAGPAVDLGVAAERVAISDQVVAALVSEAGQGQDLNGDGDMLDLVPEVNDLASGDAGTWVNLGLAAATLDLQVKGHYVAFLTSDAPAGLRIYDTATGSFLTLTDDQGNPIAPPQLDDFVLGDQIAAFRVNEGLEGQNLNGVAPPIPGGVADSDQLDSVMEVADLSTGKVYNTMQAAIPCPVEACDPRVPYRIVGRKVTFLTLEAQQGGNDLDQNGDGGTGLVIQHFNLDALTASGDLPDASDVVGGALGGICTGSAEACASNADCPGGETCYFPPGGCLLDTGTSCDPTAPNCPSGQFCAPILGMPGQGTCEEFQGACLTNGQCTAPAFCTDNGESPEQLFAAVSDQPDGRQRFVTLGSCTDGDGSCRTDADCNEGATCDGAVAVTATAADPDADGLADSIDNCPDVPNSDQKDTDGDGIGDACDRQTCGNGIQEYSEECDDGDQNGQDGLCDTQCHYLGVAPVDACNDGIDNDGDGLIDLADPGCTDASDTSERSDTLVCDDGIDNDGDYGVDVGGDPGCKTPTSAREDPACSNGIDDDGDGKIDWDGVNGFYLPDPQCPVAYKTKETKKGCGLGYELAFVLPLLRAARRKRRPRKASGV